MSCNQLRAWLKDQKLKMREKALLRRLIDYAAKESWETWVLVRVLVDDLGSNRRSVQCGLRRLEELSLIRNTGREHRMRGGRSVPIYRIAPLIDLEAKLPGAVYAPGNNTQMRPAGRSQVRPYNEQKGTDKSSLEPFIEIDWFERARAAYPQSSNTRTTEARKAWKTVAEQLDPQHLLSAVERFAASWTKLPRKFEARGFQRWLADGDYGDFLADASQDGASLGRPAALPAGNVPEDLLRAFTERFGPDLVLKYLRLGHWSEDDKTIRPPSNYGGDLLLRDGRSFFNARGITVLNADGSARV